MQEGTELDDEDDFWIPLKPKRSISYLMIPITKQSSLLLSEAFQEALEKSNDPFYQHLINKINAIHPE